MFLSGSYLTPGIAGELVGDWYQERSNNEKHSFVLPENQTTENTQVTLGIKSPGSNDLVEFYLVISNQLPEVTCKYKLRELSIDSIVFEFIARTDPTGKTGIQIRDKKQNNSLWRAFKKGKKITISINHECNDQGSIINEENHYQYSLNGSSAAFIFVGGQDAIRAYKLDDNPIQKSTTKTRTNNQTDEQEEEENSLFTILMLIGILILVFRFRRKKKLKRSKRLKKRRTFQTRRMEPKISEEKNTQANVGANKIDPSFDNATHNHQAPRNYQNIKNLSDFRLEELRQILLDSKEFTQLAYHFVGMNIELDNRCQNPSLERFFRKSVETLVSRNIFSVFEESGSPIETIFINSLIIEFIKTDLLGLVSHHIEKDAETEINELRDNITTYRKSQERFTEHNPNNSITEYHENDRMSGKDLGKKVNNILGFQPGYEHFQLENSFHMALQPKFPKIKINRKSIRPDMLFWIPSSPDIRLIVECDGFKYHSDKAKFTSDRRRDRALQAKGYQVLRYSGSEIYNDPIGTAKDLIEVLWSLQVQDNG